MFDTVLNVTLRFRLLLGYIWVLLNILQQFQLNAAKYWYKKNFDME